MQLKISNKSNEGKEQACMSMLMESPRGHQGRDLIWSPYMKPSLNKNVSYSISQAVEKFLLAEGTKIAMTKVQSAYDQGVYGLVVNLGSIAARLLLQPFEEAAFMSFSQSVPDETRADKQLGKLIPLLRAALLFGRQFLRAAYYSLAAVDCIAWLKCPVSSYQALQSLMGASTFFRLALEPRVLKA